MLAFDWGKRRIGIAVGDLELKLAHPLETRSVLRSDQDMALIAPVVKEWRPILLVVGMPSTGDGHAHPLTKRCQTFSKRLQAHFGLPAWIVDEGYSSSAAEELLKHRGVDWKARKSHLDHVAAQQILETFFELVTRASRSRSAH